MNASVIASAVGSIGSLGFAAAGNRAARRAAKAQRRIDALNAYRERVGAQRAYAMQRAEVAAAAGNEGTLGASGVQGGLVGLGSQLSAGFSYANQVDRQSSIIRRANSKAQRYGDLAGLSASLGSLGSSLFAKKEQPIAPPTPLQPAPAVGGLPPPFLSGPYPYENVAPKPVGGGGLPPSFFSGNFPNQ